MRLRAEESKKRIFEESSTKNDGISDFTPEGGLLVYYISNLILLHKHSDATKVIEQFGLKL